jgi:ferric-dicitrate binding protein FerR (iron transport regulator)
MKCDFNKEELLAYLDGEVSKTQKQDIESHLAECSECRLELDLLKKTNAIWKNTLKEEALPSDFLVKVRSRLPQKAHHKPLILRWVSFATAALILVAIGVTLLLRKTPELPIPQKGVQEFNLADGSKVIAAPGTMFTIKESNREVTLQEGELYLEVAKGNKPFKVFTPAGTITVHGTEFRVNLQKGTDMLRERVTRWVVTVMILTGVVQLTNQVGDVIGTAGESLYAEEGSAPKKQVEDLALRFAKYYEKVETKVKPEIPAYTLPLEMDKITNPDILKKIGGVDEGLLKQNGFVVKKWRGDDMVEAYDNLKKREMPIFITTDSLLHLYHIMFDETLREIEEREFYKDICAITESMLERAQKAYSESNDDQLKEAARRNVAYFTVGLKVLNPETEIVDYVKKEVEIELANIERHEGFAKSAVFTYAEDYSQYVPRGHYTRSETLKKYFKGLMWYGRLTFLIKGGTPYGPFDPYLVSPEEAKIQTLAGAMNATWLTDVKLADGRICKEAWERIYAVTSFYVGLADDLTPDEYQNGLITALGKSYNINALENNDNFFKFKTEVAKMRGPAIYSGTGASGTLDPKALMGEPSPKILDEVLDKTKGFRLMGQRFIPDSYFMGKMVFPTVNKAKSNGMFTEGGNTRVFPRGLDVMAILGSKRATQIIHDLKDDNYDGYYESLEKLQTEIDEVKSGHNWNTNLYWSWLYTLRALLPEFGKGYQTFMTTSAYLDKNLNTVLGSWSQLRHDTILYAKQSYTMDLGGLPKPVQGYVEPVPEFYARLLALNKMTLKGLSEMKILNKDWTKRITAFNDIVTKLLSISEKELQNKELTEEEYEFIRNFAYSLKRVCIEEKTGSSGRGRETTSADYRTTLIADVHTDQNTKQVLEEGTGEIELMVVAYQDPDGRIILGAGPVFSYYEFKHPMKDRLTDEAWREMLKGDKAPVRPEWTSSFRQK